MPVDSLIRVDFVDIYYAYEQWLSQPYIKINNINEFDNQMTLEKSRGLDLTLDSFCASATYAARKQPTDPDTLTNQYLASLTIPAWGKVNRPNHGLGHTLRTVAYIPEILKHLKSEDNPAHTIFKDIEEKDIKKLQYLALFSILGRLNECGWADHLMTYSYFRWRSGQIFHHYMMEVVDGNPRYKAIGFQDEQEVLYYKDQLIDMGEPSNKNPEHIILNISHKLDLMRCSNPKNKFSSRFDDYVKEFLPDSSIEELKVFGQKMIINTGEYIRTGDIEYKVIAVDRNREGSLFEESELQIDKCISNINKTIYPEVDNNPLPPFFAKASGAYQFQKAAFYDFMNNLVKDPREYRHPKFRTSERKPQHFTIRGRSILRIGEKQPQVTDEKLNYTHITSGGYIEPEDKTPLFGHNMPSWRKIVGIGIDLKDAVVNRLIRKDLNTFKRPFDFKTKIEAENKLQDLEANSRTLFASEEFDDFKSVLKDDAFKNIHNEVMARFRWNCDGTSKVYIFADTLEARLTAYHYKQYLQKRIDKTKNTLNYYSGYEVPIQFYTPYHSINGQFYTQQDHESDLKKALEIYKDDIKRRESYKENNYFFLFALKPDVLAVALQEEINDIPLWVNMITSGNNFILEQLLLKIQLPDELLIESIKADYPLDNKLIQQMAEFGFYATLSLIYNIGFKKNEIFNQIDSLIEIAIEKGRPMVFRILINMLNDPAYLRSKIDSYIFLAIEHRQLTAFPFLLDEAEPLDPKYLIAAIQAGDVRAVQILQARNLSLHQPDANGATPLHHAASAGRNAIMKLIIEDDDFPGSIDIPDDLGKTPLHYAAENGQEHTVELLINLDSSINTKDIYNHTPLYYAIKNSQTTVVEMLLENNAEIPNDLEEYLSLKSNAEIFTLLLQKKALMQTNSTPLSFSDPKVKRMLYRLVKSLGNIDPESQSEAMDLDTGVARITVILKYTNFEQSSLPYGEKTLLHYAAKQGRDLMVSSLLDLKVIDIDAQDDSGNTALHYCVEKNDLRSVEKLCANGCKVNLANSEGQTPLHLAASKSIGIFLMLIQNGANIRAIDNNGESPLDIAKKTFPNTFLMRMFEKRYNFILKMEDVITKKIAFLALKDDEISKLELSSLKEFSNDFYKLFCASCTSDVKQDQVAQLENILIFYIIKQKYFEFQNKESPDLGKLFANLIKDLEIAVKPDSELAKLIKESKLETNKVTFFSSQDKKTAQSPEERESILVLFKEYNNPKLDATEKNALKEELLNLLLASTSSQEIKMEQDNSKRFTS